MDTNLRNLIILIVGTLLIVGGIFYFVSMFSENHSTKLNEFAKCLTDKGAKFYGAFWCPHCQDQKALFGGSKQYLPYVECSTPDSNGQLQVCQDQKITVYPTWKFADGSANEGEMTLKDLAAKTSCVLPN